MEGIPGHYEASRSRDALTGGLGTRRAFQTRATRPKAASTANMQLLRKQEERNANGVCDRSVRGSIASAPWKENVHAHDPRP
jgi:hypothetical protein